MTTPSENATSFGRQAGTYARGRPGYPDALFDWIVRQSPARGAVWDVGTGSGQAARALASRFARVEATDISDAQIAAAPPHPQVRYRTAPAERSGLPGGSVDTVTVATAVHWFAGPAFWAEVRRVARPGALFCAWTYQLPIGEPDVQSAFLNPVCEIIDPYWAEGNRLCLRGYSAKALHCPFPPLDAPQIDAGGVWTAEALADFAQSWSAHLRAREDGHGPALQALRESFLSRFDDTPLSIRLPLSVFAACVE